MSLFIALLPFIILFSCLFLFKLSSLKSGLVSIVITLLISLSHPAFHINSYEIIYSLIKSILISSIAAYVIFFGLFLYHLMNETNKISTIADQIQVVTKKQELQLLLLLLGISPLIESTSGFGTAFLVITPLLMAIGYDRKKSAIIGLISLLAVPWGALAIGTVIGAEIIKIPLQHIGFISAIFSTVTISTFVLTAVYIAGRISLLKLCWKSLVLYLFLFNGINIAFNYLISTELSGVCSSLLVIFFIFSQIYIEDKKLSAVIALIRSLFPYITLTVLIFLTRLIKPIKNMLEDIGSLELPSYDFHISLLYSPGFWLLITSLITILMYKIKKEIVINSLSHTFKQWKLFVISTTCFILVAQLMEASSMTYLIAESFGKQFGSNYFVIAALIGSLGGYLTGSNTGANAMFMKLQVQTAVQLHLSPEIMAALQNTTASNATIATPSRVILAAKLCDITEQESSISRIILTVVLFSLVLVTLLLLLFFSCTKIISTLNLFHV